MPRKPSDRIVTCAEEELDDAVGMTFPASDPTVFQSPSMARSPKRVEERVPSSRSGRRRRRAVEEPS